MKTTSLDILENASLPTAQSHAILKVMELELAAAQEPLATKADLSGAEGRLSRWVLTCILGQTAVLAGWVYFILNHSGSR